jgi:uncharacterized RDD family membrane protein YckC
MATKRVGISKQGHYAGCISRLVAFTVDVGIAWVALLGIFWTISAAATIITGGTYRLSKFHSVGLTMVSCWYPIYFAYQWALSGKTLGMAIFGLRVVTTDGRAISNRQAILRTIMLPISIAVAGLGLVGIVLRVDHRGWHDRVAKTCVVYDWDARAARLRWLARQSELPPALSAISRDS